MLYQLIQERIESMFPEKKEIIKSLLTPSIGLRVCDNNSRKKFASKIGGYPDIDDDFQWSFFEGNASTFLCQINLEEISSFESLLPKEGMLYFFIPPLSEERYPELMSMIKVVYAPNIDFKINNAYKLFKTLDEFSLEFYEYYTLPSYQEKIILDLDFDSKTDDFWDLQESISELAGQEESTNHYMFGHPNAVQGGVRIFWGSRYFNPLDKYYEELDKNKDKYYALGDKFELLLQIDLSDNRIAISNLGDNCMYFGILKEDLLNKDFSRVIWEIQST